MPTESGTQSENRDLIHADYKDVWLNDLNHFLHPYTHFDTFKKDGSAVIVKSEGAYVWDSNDNKYLDGIGGLWCVNIGHGRSEIADAIAQQARQMCFYTPFGATTNIPASNLAKKIAELAPGSLNHIFFSLSGSEANDVAMRLIHYYQGCRKKPYKKHFISRNGAYHGATLAAGSLTGTESARQPEFQYLTDFIHHISNPNPYRRPAGMTEEAFCEDLIKEFEAKILELGPDNVAAFFAEPILGAGGVIVPPEGYHLKTWEVCKKYDILYVSDEVVTAFGRLGHMFASKEMFGIQPDIITSAKGLSSGYVPIAATIFSEEIWDVISAPNPDHVFALGYTYSGHPVACAAALKNIEILEGEKICEHVRETGPYLEEKLNSLRNLPIIGDVRGSHFMMGIESVKNPETKESFSKEAMIGARIAKKCQQAGVLVRPVGSFNVISPPLILSKDQIDDLVEALRKGVEAVVDELENEGLMQ
jgi:adenosylmethionine-8-amino-7-oxononanoate aminotransferase